MHARVLLATILIAGPAWVQGASAQTSSAQDHGRADLIRGLCQPDGCDEFSIVSVDPVRTTPEGSLRRTRLKTFHASYSGRVPRAEESGYVYCSPTKPAVIAEKQGRTVGILLAPFATEDSRETVRRYTNFIATYFAICHGPEAGKAAVRDLRGTAQSLGYRVPAPRSQVVDLKRAEDILPASVPPLAGRPAPRPAQEAQARHAPAQDRDDEGPIPPGEIPED
ncbi:MAG TPA: hypothetical protein VGN94_07990 [Methylobacterium sp.]|nr:hypothetical protein [Methylobacterium sp.]